MRYNALNHMQVRNLGPGKHADGQGLWLVKREPRAGKWMLRVVVYGKRREMGLGRWPDVAIAEARDRAEEARRALRDGTDPILERKRAKVRARPLSVKEAIMSCFEARKAQLKGDGVAGRWLSPLFVHIVPKLGSHPIEGIDQHALRDALAPIWHEKPEAATKALNRMHLTLVHAAALGLAVDLQATMKARALLGKQRHTVEHIPALPYADTPAFYVWLTSAPGISALALRFLMLTLARTSEVRLATFDEIKDDVWHLPASRTKTNRDRRIPLCPEALQVVAEARRLSPNEYLFPAYKGQPISDAAMATLMKRKGYEARPHGFRASFRTWAEEMTATPFEVKEGVLGHVVDTEVVRSYQRSDLLEERRALLRQWAEFLVKS
jgi:integrase